MAPLRLRLQELREARGWTQAGLARLAGVQRTTVNRLERRELKSLDVATLEKLANALGVDAGYLIVHEPPAARRARK